jgi:hypothetical protein
MYVSMLSGYRLRDRGSISDRRGVLPLQHRVQAGSEARPASCTVGVRRLFTRSEYEARHSPQSMIVRRL